MIRITINGKPLELTGEENSILIEQVKEAEIPAPEPSPAKPLPVFKPPTDKLGEILYKEEDIDRISGHLLYLPKVYEEKMPFILFLHGAGESGTILSKLKYNGPFKKISEGMNFNAIVGAPQARWGWDDGFKSLDKYVQQMIDTHNIDESRIYVTGLSAGGNACWDYTVLYPHRVAAAVPVVGWCNHGSKICNAKDIPIRAYYNSGDPMGAGTPDLIRRLHACGNKDAKYISYPGSGHDSWTKTYNDISMWEWLMSQQKA